MKHLMGSNYFFGNFSDFKVHDTDYIELTDNPDVKRKLVIRGQGMDYIQLRRKPKDILIQEALAENFPLALGKFLIPEFDQEINFNLNDLLLLTPMVKDLDAKHQYEKIIFEAYLENKSFTLTEEQLEEAYAVYKEARKDSIGG